MERYHTLTHAHQAWYQDPLVTITATQIDQIEQYWFNFFINYPQIPRYLG